jgi:outer membrane protein
MKINNTWLLLWTMLCSLPLWAQEPVAEGEPLSLSQAIRIGLENTYQVKIAENNLEIARNENDPGFAGALPDVNLNLNFNNSYTNDRRQASFLEALSTGGTNISPGVEVLWTLYDGGRVQLTKELLEDNTLRSEGEVRIAIENTMQDVIVAYWEVLLREENLKVTREVLQLSRDRIEFEEVKKEYGQASTFDILQTRDAYLNDSTSYISQLTSYQNAMHNLNRAMGVTDIGRTYQLTDSLTVDGPDFSLEGLRQQMLRNNNQLNNLYVDQELAQINTQLQESERLPSLNLRTGATYGYGRTLFGTGTFADGNERELAGNVNKTLNGFINFSATYNIFNGGARSINIQNAKIRELNAQHDIDDTRLNLNAQLENTYVVYANQKQLVAVTTDLLDNARRNLEIAEERFRGGLINSFDYRTIQLQFINASQARLQAIFNLRETETELRRLVGDLVR